jgi:hypothetical protein
VQTSEQIGYGCMLHALVTAIFFAVVFGVLKSLFC